MKRFCVTESQLHTNGAIACLSLDHGGDERAAKSHYHNALASGLASGLIACTVTLVGMEDDTGFGFVMTETVKGNGVLAE